MKLQLIVKGNIFYFLSKIVDLDECRGKKCGDECDGGVCNGGGFCNLSFGPSGVNAGLSPCFAEGCDGKTCGDQCLSGGILGSCNQAGKCVNIELVTCGNYD